VGALPRRAHLAGHGGLLLGRARLLLAQLLEVVQAPAIAARRGDRVGAPRRPSAQFRALARRNAAAERQRRRRAVARVPAACGATRGGAPRRGGAAAASRKSPIVAARKRQALRRSARAHRFWANSM
jgi:hypothetical protein